MYQMNLTNSISCVIYILYRKNIIFSGGRKMGLFDFLKKKEEEVKEFNGKIIAPISGEIMALENVDDAVFSV